MPVRLVEIRRFPSWVQPKLSTCKIQSFLDARYFKPLRIACHAFKATWYTPSFLVLGITVESHWGSLLFELFCLLTPPLSWTNLVGLGAIGWMLLHKMQKAGLCIRWGIAHQIFLMGVSVGWVGQFGESVLCTKLKSQSMRGILKIT